MAGFEVLITVDQNMPYQQSVAGRAISIVVLRARTTAIWDLLALMPEVLRARGSETGRGRHGRADGARQLIAGECGKPGKLFACGARVLFSYARSQKKLADADAKG